MADTSQVADSVLPANMYKWVVLTASFFTMFTTGSSSYASGVFHVALQETFPNASLTLLVWTGSLFLCMFGPGAVLAGGVINEFSCRTCVFLSGILGLVGFSLNFFIMDVYWLLITYGIMAGISIGLATAGAIVVLGFYFESNVNIATSIALTGQALGMFGHPPLTQYLIDTYGLRGAFLLYGGMAANSCVLAMLMRPSHLERSTQEMIKSGRSSRSQLCKILFDHFSNYSKLLRNGAFLFIFTGYLTFGMSIAISFLYLPEFFQKYGGSKEASALALSMSGIGSIVSRLFAGVLSQDKRAGSGLVFTGCNGIIGIITLFTVFFTGSTVKMMIYGLCLGLYTGGNWALISPLSLEILGLQLSASGVGFLLLGCGIGYLSGPPLSTSAFLTTSLCGIMSTLTRDKDSFKRESSAFSTSGKISKPATGMLEERTMFVSVEKVAPEEL